MGEAACPEPKHDSPCDHGIVHQLVWDRGRRKMTGVSEGLILFVHSLMICARIARYPEVGLFGVKLPGNDRPVDVGALQRAKSPAVGDRLSGPGAVAVDNSPCQQQTGVPTTARVSRTSNSPLRTRSGGVRQGLSVPDRWFGRRSKRHVLAPLTAECQEAFQTPSTQADHAAEMTRELTATCR